jgi:hypothetical protein
MTVKEKIGNITKYFGFIMPVIAWGTILIVCIIHPLDTSEPLSQFGYYSSTRFFFGVSLTVGAITWYLFSRHLDQYWKHTSLSTLLAGFCYIILAWTPYQPYVREFLFDTHNVTTILAATLYSLPMIFIAYSKKHESMARISGYLFVTTALFVLISIVARVLGYGVLYPQLLTLLPTTIWLIITNSLLLEHHKELARKL